jgi:hypothetical protein
MAEDALKSVPQFSGGHEEFIDWQQAAQSFIGAGYYSAAAAFQLLKKTLDGRPKKLVEKMSLQEPDLLQKMMKKLKKEYADGGQLSVLQKQKIAKHPTVGFGANNLQDFYDLVEQTYSILIKTERLGNEKEFIGLVITRLPRAYQNRIGDALDRRSSVKLLLRAMERLVDREKDEEWRQEALGLKRLRRKTKRKRKTIRRKTRRRTIGRKRTRAPLSTRSPPRRNSQLADNRAARKTATSAAASTTSQIAPGSRVFPSTSDCGRLRTSLCTSVSVV